MEDTNKNNQEQASFDPSPNTEFLREKIKQKPINKKKLIRRTFITVLSAAIFGLVACFTFIILEPVISNKLNSTQNYEQNTPAQVTISETDEISPEDMYANDTEMIEEAIQGNVENVNQNIQNIEAMVSNIEFGIDDYQKLYTDIRNLSETVAGSVVTVTGVTSETDLLSNTYQDSAQRSGVIVADNGVSLLIMVKDVGFSSADVIRITFKDGTVVDGTMLARDDTTRYMIIEVAKKGLQPITLTKAVPATFGTSRSATLKGSPIIAVGSPTGITDSVAYGMITSASQQMSITDADYAQFSTDILGNDYSSGIIVSLRGNVIGIIDNTYDNETGSGIVKAIGITELKPLIETLSNAGSKAYLGIKGVDTTKDMRDSYGLPEGIYISSIELDSPAMNSGLQNGDILETINGETVLTYHDLMLWLASAEPGTEARLTIKRKSVDDYVTLKITVTLGEVNYKVTTE